MDFTNKPCHLNLRLRKGKMFNSVNTINLQKIRGLFSTTGYPYKFAVHNGENCNQNVAKQNFFHWAT